MAETIQISLKDGKILEAASGTTAAQIAERISPRLLKEALVARISVGANVGSDAPLELVDLSAPLDRDVRLEILTDKNPESLTVFRHSAAHLLAAAVLELFPDVKLGIGPPIEYGFFYEFMRDGVFYSGRSGGDREADARDRVAQCAKRAEIFAEGGGDRTL